MEQIIANGLYLGAQYALIALGLTLIFSLMNVLNFAHGQMFVFGGFVTYTVVAKAGLPFVVGLLASAVILAALGAVAEVFLFRPVIKRSKRDESTMLLAAGVAFFFQAQPFAQSAGIAGRVSGFKNFLDVMEAEAVAWKKPVLLVNADEHRYRLEIGMPFEMGGEVRANVTRLATFGAGDIHAVKVTVDASSSQVFLCGPLLVPGNALPVLPRAKKASEAK